MLLRYIADDTQMFILWNYTLSFMNYRERLRQLCAVEKNVDNGDMKSNVEDNQSGIWKFQGFFSVLSNFDWIYEWRNEKN